MKSGNFPTGPAKGEEYPKEQGRVKGAEGIAGQYLKGPKEGQESPVLEGRLSNSFQLAQKIQGTQAAEAKCVGKPQ